MSFTNFYDILASAADNDNDGNTTSPSGPSSPSTTPSKPSDLASLSSSNPFSIPPCSMSWADEKEEELEMEAAAAQDRAATESVMVGATDQTDRWEPLGEVRRARPIMGSSTKEESGDSRDDETGGEDEGVFAASLEADPKPDPEAGEDYMEGYATEDEEIDTEDFGEDYDGFVTTAALFDIIELEQAALRTYPASEPAPLTDSWDTFTTKLPAPSSPAEATREPVIERFVVTERVQAPDVEEGMDAVARYWWNKPVSATPVADSWNEYVARFPEHCQKIGMKPLTPEGSRSPLAAEDEADATEAAGAFTVEDQSAPSTVDSGNDAIEQELEVSGSSLPPTEVTEEPVEGKKGSEGLHSIVPAAEHDQLPESSKTFTEKVQPSTSTVDSWDEFVARTPQVWKAEPAATVDASVEHPPSSTPGTLPYATTPTATPAATFTMAPATPAKESISITSSPPEAMSSPLPEIVERLKKPSVFTLDGQRDFSPTLSPARSTTTKSTLPLLEEVSENEVEVIAGAEEVQAITETDVQRSQPPPKTFGRHASARRALERASERAMVETAETSSKTEAAPVKSDAEAWQTMPAKRSCRSNRETKEAGNAAAAAASSLSNVKIQPFIKPPTDAEDLQENPPTPGEVDTSFPESASEENTTTDSEATAVATPASEPEADAFSARTRDVQESITEFFKTASGIEESTTDANDVAVDNTTPHDDDDDSVDAQESINESSVVIGEPTSLPEKKKRNRPTKAQRRRAAKARADALPDSGAIGVSETYGYSVMTSHEDVLRGRNAPMPVNVSLGAGNGNLVVINQATGGSQNTLDNVAKPNQATLPIMETIRTRAQDLLVAIVRIQGYTVPWGLIIFVGLLYVGWLAAQIAS